jgi:hypothetical protein
MGIGGARGSRGCARARVPVRVPLHGVALCVDYCTSAPCHICCSDPI